MPEFELPASTIKPSHITVPTISTLKVILLLLLFALTFGASLIPFALRRAATQAHPQVRRRKFAATFALLSCFGGGVFLATCLLDLLPHAHENINAALKGLKLYERYFPLSEFLVAIGFFIVLTVEQLVLWFRENSEDNSDEPENAHGHSHEHSHNYHEHRTRAHTTLNTVPTYDNRPGEEEPEEIRDDISSTTTRSGEGLLEGAEVDIHFDPESHSTFRAVILVVALSLHAVFEGLALGLVDNTSSALQLFGALSIHKFILGFSLGLRLVQSKLSSFGIALSCLIFAIMAPIGGFIGVAVSDFVSKSNASMVSGCLGAIACGTFLYVTAFEILPHELNERGYRILKLLTLFLGFAVIAVFVLVFPDK